jgi:hypothetical protein
VVAKYAVGNKVRIKSHGFPERFLEPNIHLYEYMTGEIIELTQVVAFMAGTNLAGLEQQVSIYHYTVKIDDRTVLNSVLEDYLETIS